MSNNNPRGSKPTIGRLAQDRIGRQLRAIYEQVVEEPLPEEIRSLLRAFEEAETAQHCLRQAIDAVRRANTGAGLTLTPRSNLALPVHAQQAIVERSLVARSV